MLCLCQYLKNHYLSIVKKPWLYLNGCISKIIEHFPDTLIHVEELELDFHWLHATKTPPRT